MRRSFAVVALLAASGACAADAARPFASPAAMPAAVPTGVGSLGQVTVALGLVLVAIFAAAWLLRRVRGFGRAAPGALEVLADLPLGQKEHAVLIRVGTRQILIGVAPGRVSTLHVLTEPVEISAPSATGGDATGKPNFKALLLKSLGR